MSYDYTVLAGTQGLQNHRKKDRLFEVAERQRLPGGVLHRGRRRPARRHRRHRRVRPRLPRLQPVRPAVRARAARRASRAAAASPATPPSSGAATSSSPPRARNIGMGGPAMVEGGGLGVFPPEAIGPMDVQVPNGVVDVAVPDEAAAVDVARQYLSYFQGPTDDVGRRPTPRRARAVDPGEPAHGLRRAGGRRRHRRRRLGARAARRLRARAWSPRWSASRAGRWASSPTTRCTSPAPSTPTAPTRRPASCSSATPSTCRSLFLCDTPGIMVGPEAEQTALVRHVSRLFVTGANLTVPTGTIILRKGYGLGAQAMAGGSFKAPLFCVAWPTGELGGMGLEGAVRLGYRKELEAIEDPTSASAPFQEMVDRMYEHGKAVNAASHFEIDDVIDPADSRRWITSTFGAAPPPGARDRQEAPEHRHLVTGRLGVCTVCPVTAALDRQGRRRHHRPALRRPGAQVVAADRGRRRRRRGPGRHRRGPRRGRGAARSSTSVLTARRARPLGADGRAGHRAREPRRSSSTARRWCPTAMVRGLEAVIDDIGGRFELPAEFVVPGQDRTSALLDVARTVVRRAERAAAAGAGRRLARRCPTSTASRRCCGSSPAGPRASRCPPAPRPTRAAPDPGGPRCPSPSSSPAPLPPTSRPPPSASSPARPRAAGVDWGYLAGQGFEAKKGDVRAAARRRRQHHLRGRVSARPPRSTPTCCAPPPGALARAAKRHAIARGRPPRRRRRRHQPRPRGAQAIAEGLVLGGYQFSDLQVRAEAVGARAGSSSSAAAASAPRTPSTAGSPLAEAVCWARDLENEPGGSLTPTELAKRAAAGGQAAPASRSRCGTRRRSASRSSAACSA